MKKGWKAVVLCLLALLCVCLPVHADRYAPYEVEFSSIPAWGQDGPIMGRIYESGSPYEGTEVRVKLFLRVEENGQWWPKPTYDQPYVDPDYCDFAIPYNTGGDDIHAVEIALMLVRPEDAASLDFEEADAHSLYTATIRRTPEGNIYLSHSYRGEQAWLPDLGLDIGFYTEEGSSPGSPLSDNHIRKILRAAAAYTDTVRFYTTTGEVAKAYPIAQGMGFSVAATAWLDGSSHDQEELDALIDLCNRHLAKVAIVGNETLLTGRLTEEELIRDIEYVRQRITDPEIPVTTSDIVSFILGNEKVRDACDILAVNIYPFWNGLTAEQAADDLTGTMESLIAFAGGKKILISETGWPSDGQSTAGIAEQSQNLWDVASLSWKYYEELYDVFWFDLADEPWKAESEGECGAHWGLVDKDLNAKNAAFEYYWSWVPPQEFMSRETELE